MVSSASRRNRSLLSMAWRTTRDRCLFGDQTEVLRCAKIQQDIFDHQDPFTMLIFVVGFHKFS